MPLTALIDGKRVVSSLCEDDEWDEIVATARQGKDRVLMGYSGLPCYPRVSKLGLRHFAHRRGVDAPALTAPETPEHLLAKTLIVQAAARLGWDAQTEVPAEDGSWVADTLLTKEGRRIAIEVQWSRQSPGEYQRRQERYEAEGIECIWLHRHKIEFRERNTCRAPLFRLSVDKESRTASVSVNIIERDEGWMETDDLDLPSFITAALTYGLVTPSPEHLSLWISRCWSCRHEMACWTLRGGVMEEFFVPQNPMRTLEVRSALEQLRETIPGVLGLPEFAVPRDAWTKTSGTKYTAFHCPRCGRLQGDFFFMSEHPFAEVYIPTGVSSRLTRNSVWVRPEDVSAVQQEVSAIQDVVRLMKRPLG